MMKTPLSCLMRGAALAALLAAGSAHAVQDCDIAGQSVNPNNGNTTAGKTGLMRCKDRDTGVIQREQELQNGKFMGLVRHYENGKLQKEHSVNEQGNRHGRAREFAADGTVLVDTQYDNGSTVGIDKRFHANGKLRRATFYDGSNSEKASAEFNAQGQLFQLRCTDRPVLSPVVDDARLCGFNGLSRLEMFDERGALYARTQYLNGERVRFEQLYSSGKTQVLQEVSATRRLDQQFSQDGVKRREEERTLDGKRIVAMRLQQFSETGTLVKDQRWQEGRLTVETSFYLNGQPKSKTEYTRDAAGGANDRAPVQILETEYRDDGKLVATGRYLETGRRRVATGTHQVFNPAGRVVAESVYDDKGRISREKSWDDAGTLLRDDAVFEDGSRKAFAR